MDKVYLVTVNTTPKGEYGKAIDAAGIFKNRITAELLAESYHSKGFRVYVDELEVGKQYPIVRAKCAWEDDGVARKRLFEYFE